MNRSARRDTGWTQTWLSLARNVWHSRELVWQLFKRDFQGGHRKSFLGMGWMIVQPLLEAFFWIFLQMTGLLRPGPTGIAYAAYAFLGITLWTMFTGYYRVGASILSAGGPLLLKINYPHEITLARQTIGFTVTFAVRFILMLAVLALFGVLPGWNILWFPLVALPVFFLASAIGILVALLMAISVDAEKLMDFVLRLLMFAIPLIYSDRIGSPLLRTINHWNPLTYLLCSCRDILLYGRLYHAAGYLVCAVAAMLAFLAAWRAFFIAEKRLVERML